MRAKTRWTVLAVAALLGCSGKVTTLDSNAGGDGGSAGSGGTAGSGGSVVGGSGGGTAGTAGGASGTAGAGAMSGSGGDAGTGGATGGTGGATGGTAGATGGTAGATGGTGGATGGTGGATGGTGGATGGTGGAPACPIDTGWPPCNDCIQTECGSECADCVSEPACNQLLECILDCPNDQCIQTCANLHPGGINTILALFGDGSCTETNCGPSCGTGGSGGTGGTGGTGGSGGYTSCPIQSGEVACDDCINDSCLNECLTCVNNPQCVDLWTCVAGCSGGQTCINDCAQQYPSGINPLMELVGQDGCVSTQCAVECNTGTGGTAGSGGSPSQCTLTTGDAACDACMNASCLSQCESCAATAACVSVKECIDQCPPSDTGCQWQCAQLGGTATYLGLFGPYGCLANNCANECP